MPGESRRSGGKEKGRHPPTCRKQPFVRCEDVFVGSRHCVLARAQGVQLADDDAAHVVVLLDACEDGRLHARGRASARARAPRRPHGQ